MRSAHSVFGVGLREMLAGHRQQLASIAAFHLVGSLPFGDAHVRGRVSPPDRPLQRLRVNAEAGVKLAPADVPWLGAADEMIKTWVLAGVCQRSRSVERYVVLRVHPVEVAGGHSYQPC